MDGRAELIEEIQAADPGLRRFIAKEVGALLRTPQFLDAMPGHLPPDAASQQRASLLVERLKAIAGLGRG